MTIKLAENDIVELTWWDEYDSKESTEISVYSEHADGSGDIWLSIGDLTLSLLAWEVLSWQIEKLTTIEGLQDFINRHKVVDGEVKVLSNNSVQWTRATSPKVE